jgi:hypothetical protein
MAPVADRDPQGPYGYNPTIAAQIAGAYENEAMTLTVTDCGVSIWLEARLKPEIRAAWLVELPADYEPFEIEPRPWNSYAVTSGPLQGQSGHLARDAGEVTGLGLAGRFFRRLP